MGDGVRGGWHFCVECVVCHAEATFDGVVMNLAVDKAVKAGWGVDWETVYRPLSERTDLCPKHHRRSP